MPAYRVFAILQQHRRSLVKFVDAASSEETSATLQTLIRIALRSADFTAKTFMQVGTATGRWNASGLDLTVDLQTCEIMWRNDELKPVPDSMVQYGDFEQLFGREALHCGIVARQQHRHWVHVIGTECDLIEWDAPASNNQGVGAPTALDPEANKEPEPAPAGPTQGQIQRQMEAMQARAREEEAARKAAALEAEKTPDPGIVAQLASMGFSENGAKRAALATKNSGVNDAMDWCVKHMEDANFNDPLDEDDPQTTAAKPKVEPDAIIVKQLVSMGFPENGCKRAAIACNNGNVESCMNWILSHQDDADFNDPLKEPEPEADDEAQTEAEPELDVASELPPEPVEADSQSQLETQPESRLEPEPQAEPSTSPTALTPDAISAALAAMHVAPHGEEHHGHGHALVIHMLPIALLIMDTLTMLMETVSPGMIIAIVTPGMVMAMGTMRLPKQSLARLRKSLKMAE